MADKSKYLCDHCFFYENGCYATLTNRTLAYCKYFVQINWVHHPYHCDQCHFYSKCGNPYPRHYIADGDECEYFISADTVRAYLKEKGKLK